MTRLLTAKVVGSLRKPIYHSRAASGPLRTSWLGENPSRAYGRKLPYQRGGRTVGICRTRGGRGRAANQDL